MCGIAGTFGILSETVLPTMTEALRHRGPDAAGFHRREGLRLGMRRLSIIDLATGDQPIYNEKGDVAIVLNGEIYNYRQLRERLKGLGHVFRTGSDTEVVVHLYEEYGLGCVDHLQGMFTFAIDDGERLLLARDRLGIKPLYYAFTEDRLALAFASEIKALLRSGLISPALSEAGFSDYLIWGAPTEDRTLFEGVFSLEPGHVMVCERDGVQLRCRKHQYYAVEVEPDADLGFEEASTRLADLLRATVRSHLIADVEVGISASGGLDSSLLALLMAEESNERILAFSIGDREDHPDLIHAERLCRSLECVHEITIPGFEDYLAAIPGCIFAIERPTRLYGLPLYMLSRLMGSRVKVALCGEGADEIFGGYREFRDRNTFRSIPDKIQACRQGGLPISDGTLELAELAAPGDLEEADYLKRAFTFNMRRLAVHHLETTDKYAMAASLELRVPFMDHHMVELAHRLPFAYRVDLERGLQKHILKHVALRQPGHGIEAIARREKMGFPQSILGNLARIRSLCEELLPAAYRSRHERGRWFSGNFELLMFDLFCEIFFTGGGELQEGFDFVEFARSR